MSLLTKFSSVTPDILGLTVNPFVFLQAEEMPPPHPRLYAVNVNKTTIHMPILYIQDLGLSVVSHKQHKHTDLLGLRLRLLPDGIKDSKRLWTNLLLMT